MGREGVNTLGQRNSEQCKSHMSWISGMEEAGAKDPHGKAEEGGWSEEGTERCIDMNRGQQDKGPMDFCT